MTRLTKLSLANRLVVGMITVAIVVFGVLAAFSLRQELLPSTQIPTAFVTASYPGTAPALVADEVAKPLEQAFSGISGVTKVRSDSTNGLANLTVEWTYGLDNDKLIGDIRAAADALAPQLPEQVEIEVFAGSTDDIPVLVLGISSDKPLTELARQVDDIIVPQLSGVEGVRQVQVAGQDTTELVVTLKPTTAAQVRPERRGRHPGGPEPGCRGARPATPMTTRLELAIQVGDTPTSVKQVASWPIPAPRRPGEAVQARRVRVESIAATTLARATGRPALSMSVLKESDADAVSHLPHHPGPAPRR